MKTIEEAAREFCNIRKDLVIDEEERYYRDFQKYDGFKAGVEFTQRWIPIEEKLPEDFELVLTKNAKGIIKLDRYDSSYKRFSEIRRNGDATHWRPIELK